MCGEKSEILDIEMVAQLIFVFLCAYLFENMMLLIFMMTKE